MIAVFCEEAGTITIEPADNAGAPLGAESGAAVADVLVDAESVALAEAPVESVALAVTDDGDTVDKPSTLTGLLPASVGAAVPDVSVEVDPEFDESVEVDESPVSVDEEVSPPLVEPPPFVFPPLAFPPLLFWAAIDSVQVFTS